MIIKMEYYFHRRTNRSNQKKKKNLIMFYVFTYRSTLFIYYYKGRELVSLAHLFCATVKKRPARNRFVSCYKAKSVI